MIYVPLPEQHSHVGPTRWKARLSSIAHSETSQGSHCTPPNLLPLPGREPKVTESLKLVEVPLFLSCGHVVLPSKLLLDPGVTPPNLLLQENVQEDNRWWWGWQAWWQWWPPRHSARRRRRRLPRRQPGVGRQELPSDSILGCWCSACYWQCGKPQTATKVSVWNCIVGSLSTQMWVQWALKPMVMLPSGLCAHQFFLPIWLSDSVCIFVCLSAHCAPSSQHIFSNFNCVVCLIFAFVCLLC